MAQIRNNSNIVKGDELWMFIGETSTTHPICFATQHQLSRSLSTNSVSSKDHGSSNYITPGEGTWTVSSESLMSIADGADGAYAFEKLMDLYAAQSLVYVTFGKISNYTGTGIVDVDVTGTAQANGWTMATPYWEGQGYITNLQATGAHGDTATFSIEINGNGPLEKKTSPGPTPTTYTLTLTGTDAAKLTASATTNITAGTQIRLTPVGEYNIGNFDLTSSPEVSISSNASYFYFDMPASNLSIAVVYQQYTTFSVVLNSDEATRARIASVVPQTDVAIGTTVQITPAGSYSYIDTNVTAISAQLNLPVTWVANSYWEFVMQDLSPETSVYVTASEIV